MNEHIPITELKVMIKELVEESHKSRIALANATEKLLEIADQKSLDNLRGQFAMAALPSVITEHKKSSDNSVGFGKTYIPFCYKAIAKSSYKLADNMLEARKVKDDN
jgi:hypothetical protein